MPWWLKNLRIWLFVATFFSVCFASSYFIFRSFDYQNPLSVFSGLPFACALMFILLSHELGHYLTAKR